MQDTFAPFRNALQLYMQSSSLPAQAAQTIAMDRRQQEQNAMANTLRNLQMEEIQRRMQKEQGMDNALSTLFSRQRQPGTGPMRGVADYQPGAMQTPQPAYADIRSRLAPFGVEGLSVAEKFRPSSDEYQIIEGQYVPKAPGGPAIPIPGFVSQTPYKLTETAEGFAYLPETIKPGEKAPTPVKLEGVASSKALVAQQQALKDAKELKASNFKNANDLRDEYSKQSGEFIKVRDAYNRINASAQEPSAAGDLALIFNYMKMLDPGSTVREGEFANAQNAGGVPDRFRSAFNRVLSGERLSENQRRDFLGQARELYGAANKLQDGLKSEYTRLAKRFEVDPQDVIVDYRAQLETKTPQFTEGQTATNPQTGQKIVFSNGQWSPQ